MPRATLDWEARRLGRRAEDQRRNKDQQTSQGAGRRQVVPELQLADAVEPFTLVIELDTWNIRERNPEDWERMESLCQSEFDTGAGTDLRHCLDRG